MLREDPQFAAEYLNAVSEDGDQKELMRAPQLHAVLLQGMALAGFNVIDLDGLHEALEIPVLVVARRALTWARSAVRSSTRSREERESGASSNKPARWNRSRA